MKLFGFFGKSSDDEEDANAEETIAPDLPDDMIRPNKHPPHLPSSR